MLQVEDLVLKDKATICNFEGKTLKNNSELSFKSVNTIKCQIIDFFKMYLVLMSSSLERVWLERATLEAVKSEAWSLMSSAILCKGLRHELCI